MCVVAAAAASWLALLAAPRLYPVVCQTAKRGKRWDKWLFMICHIPSSLLSPGPIYYSCRLPPCRGECAHTDTKYCTVCALAQWPNTHACTQSDFFQYFYSVQHNISQGQFAILSSALLWELSKLHLICTLKNQMLHFSRCLCIKWHMADKWYFTFSLHVSRISLHQTFCSWTQ